jgi:hypothetical protein
VRKQEVMDVLHFVLEESKRGNAVNMTECFSTISTNNMTQMMFGLRFCRSGPSSNLAGKYTWMPETMSALAATLGSNNIGDLIPALKRFDLQGLLKPMKIIMMKLDGVLEEIIAERREMKSSARSTGTAEDFMDALLNFSQTNEYGECLSMDEVKATLLVSF